MSQPVETGIASEPNNQARCICQRPPGFVICKTCGQSTQSRVNKRCSEHPYVIHLMDMELCPSCFSENLVETHPFTRPKHAAAHD